MRHTLLCSAILMIVHVATGQDWTWKPANGPFGGPIRALVTNVNGVIFAGTETRGVFMSDDHGGTWKRTGLDSMMISDLAVDSLGSILAAGPGQLFRSADGGNIWTGLLPPGTTAGPTCIAVDGGQRILLGTTKGLYWSPDNGVQWTVWQLSAARVVSAMVTRSGAWLVGMSSRMYRSTDKGASWAATESTFTPTAFSTTALDTLLAGSDMKGFFESGDDGATWSLRASAEGKTITRITARTPDTLFAAVQPLDPSIPGGVIRSTDAGTTWSQWGLVHTSVYDLIMDGHSDLFAGTYHGAFSSPGADSLWLSQDNGLTNVTVSALAAPSATEVLAGTNVGMFYSPDAGASWINCFPELTAGAVQAVASQGCQRFFFSSMLFSPLGGIYRSEDHGQTWDHVSGTTITGLYISIGGLLVTREQILLAGTSQGRIYRSTNWGDAWTRVDSAGSTGGVKAMVADSAGRLFLASAAKGVFISTDAGLTWADRSTGMARKNLLCLVAKDSSLLFAGSTSGVLMRSHDAGLHWTSLTHGASGNVHALAVTSHGHVLASIGTILLRSTDDGDTWDPDTSGLPGMTWLAVTATSDSIAYVGADKQPVFRLSRTVTGIPSVSTRVPEQVRLEQNFPNPFNPSTTIRFFLPVRAMVRLTVWNMLGQRVAVVRDEQMDAGQHECVFRANGLASGVFFYRLEAGRFTETRRFLLLR